MYWFRKQPAALCGLSLLFAVFILSGRWVSAETTPPTSSTETNLRATETRVPSATTGVMLDWAGQLTYGNSDGSGTIPWSDTFTVTNIAGSGVSATVYFDATDARDIDTTTTEAEFDWIEPYFNTNEVLRYWPTGNERRETHIAFSEDIELTRTAIWGRYDSATKRYGTILEAYSGANPDGTCAGTRLTPANLTDPIRGTDDYQTHIDPLLYPIPLSNSLTSVDSSDVGEQTGTFGTFSDPIGSTGDTLDTYGYFVLGTDNDGNLRSPAILEYGDIVVRCLLWHSFGYENGAALGEGEVRTDLQTSGYLGPIIFNTIPQGRIGDFVWYDADGDGSVNGSETGYGLHGVTVELISGTTTISTTTTVNGHYSFVHLEDGDYTVRIPSSNFTSGSPLNGFSSSSVDGGDPDNDTDNDDNGDGSGTATNIDSLPITLAEGTEPITTTLQGDTNDTIDFGFTASTCSDANDLGGSIFRDYDNDGVNDTSSSPDVAFYDGNTIINAYDDTNGIVETTYVRPDGTYVFDNIFSTYSAIRLEFVGLPSYLNVGYSSMETQFYAAGTCSADLGVQNSGDYCESNPRIGTACYVNGDPLKGGNTGTSDWLVAFRYDNSGQKTDGGYIAPELMVNGTTLGATWGLAYHRETEMMLASALMKRHSGFGSGGTGAIYTISNTGVVTELLDLNDYSGVQSGADTRDNTANNSLPSDYGTANRDIDAFAAVGKVGIGDIDISSDGQYLYIVNLHDRSLHEIFVGSTLTAPASIATYDIAAGIDALYPSWSDASACSSSADYRPWAVKYHDGIVYVGVVCSDETTPSANTLRAYVISFDPSNPSGGFSKVVDVALAGAREAAFEDDNVGDPNELAGTWLPWTTDWTSVLTNGWFGAAQPSPILSDIEVDTDGSLIIGLMDRFGLQSGVDQYGSDPSDNTLYEGIGAGDTLRFCNVNGTYVFEGNPSCPFNDANEFYSGDEYFQNAGQTDDFGHPELSLGSLALLPGSGEVVASIYDPFAIKSGGIAWWSNSDGSVNKEYELYNESDSVDNGYAGKAVGLGDLELLCQLAPIEVGNRVWEDSDSDGVQDPSESGIDGVTVTLTCGGDSSNVVTAGGGLYNFSNASGGNATFMDSGEACTISVASIYDNGTVHSITTGSSSTNDLHDNDADTDGNILFTVGATGENNHSFDIGYAPAKVNLGNFVWYDADGDGLVNGNEAGYGLSGVSVELISGTTTISTTMTVGGYYSFVNLDDGDYSVRIPSANFGTGQTLNGFTSSAIDGGDPDNNTDDDDNGDGSGTATNINSLTVTLAIGTEPMTTTISGDTNNSVDFGFTAPTCFDPTDLGGDVFRDYDNDGVNDIGSSPDVAFYDGNTIVNAYDNTNSVVMTTYVRPDGTYLFDDIFSTYSDIRLEFTGLPSNLDVGYSGTNNGTAAQFYSSGTCSADLGVHDSADYCEDNPELATTCFVQQQYTGTYSDDITIVQYPFTSIGDSDDGGYVPPTPLATHNETGATYGVAYQRDTETLFVSSYLRKGSGFGGDGPGAIYAIDNAGNVTLHADINTIFAGNPAGVDPHNFDGDPLTNFYDSGVDSANIAQVAFGDLDISRDGQTLYAVSLADRQIYAIPALVTPTSANITQIPTPQPASCGAADTRPFALGIDQTGDLYVGIGCDATGAEQYVYRYDGGTSFTQVLTFNSQELDTGQGAIQLLVDIVFDKNRDMTLGVRDVIGDAYWGDFRVTVGVGELYRACWNGAGWDFESNGQCGGVSGHDTAGSDYEFYDDGGPSAIFQTPIGGLALGGQDSLAVNFADPIRLQSSGTVFYGANGEQSRQYEVYQSLLPEYGKVNGLGDLEALCSVAPVEVGNRVWNDADGDGVQDPDEAGIDGVTVTLTCGADSTSVVTANGGQYYFGNSADYDDSASYREQALFMDSSESCALSVSNQNITTGIDATNDEHDNDANSSGVITFIAGVAGENNHTFDIGIIPTQAQLGNFVWYDADGNGVVNNNEANYGLSGVSVELISGTTTISTTTTVGGYYSFVNLDDGDYSVRIPSANFGTGQTLNGFTSSATDGGDPDNDTDNDDNGDGSGTATDINSQVVTLAVGTEPMTTTVSGDTNNTVDFGFTAPICIGGNDLGGTVFRDLDYDGVYSVLDFGFYDKGIIVYVYDSDNNVIDQTILRPDGTYLFEDIFASNDDLRLEFAGLPDYLDISYKGASNGTETQIHKTGSCDADLGIHEADSYCESNPLLFTSCFIIGDNLTGTHASEPASAAVTFDADGEEVDKYLMAPATDIGSTYGVAWSRQSQELFVASYVKSHTGLGPNGSGGTTTGGIYQIATNSPVSTTSGTLFIDLQALGFNTGADPHPAPSDTCTSAGGIVLTNENCWLHDAGTYPVVGMRGLGDLEFSNDGELLYTVNLNTQELIEIPVGSPAVAPAAGDINVYATPSADCSNNEAIPFALKSYKNKLYLGVTCTAFTSRDRNDLQALVYEFDRGTGPGTESYSLIFSAELDHKRDGIITSWCDTGAGDGIVQTNTFNPSLGKNLCPSDWIYWTNDMNDMGLTQISTVNLYTPLGPQPMLVDIEFDKGDLLLGIRDRTADQFGTGSGNPLDINDTRTYSGVQAGDLLRACAADGGGWELEIDGTCGGRAGGNLTNGEGPGTGEFYADFFTALGHRHGELFGGGITIVGSQNAVAASIMDATTFNEGAIASWNNTSGTQINGARLYTSDPSVFAKANGLGDLEAMCTAAPLEIGNYIWADDDGNGIQDPSESGLVNVDVTLYSITGTIVATTTTNSNGEYYFNDSNVTQNGAAGLQPNTIYNVCVPLDDSDLGDRVATTQDYASNANHPTSGNSTDVHDSDGDNGTILADHSCVQITTGNAGENDYTIDFGFFLQEVNIGNRVWLEDDGNGVADSLNDNSSPVVGTVVTATASNNAIYTGTTDSSGLYTITVPANATYTVTVATPTNYTPSTIPASPADNENHGSGVVVTVGATDDLTIDFGFTPNLLADWGDLPEGSPVQLGENGPYHVMPSGGATPTVWLGANQPDLENNGQPDVEAVGDDGSSSDEDGFFRTTQLGAGLEMLTYINVRGSAPTADVGYWIDFDANGYFTDTADFFEFYDNYPTGDNSHIAETVTVPGTIDGTTPHPRVRIRIYPASFATEATHAATVLPTGGVEDGEVEDHLIQYEATAVGLVGIGTNSAEIIPLLLLLITLAIVTIFLVQRLRQSKRIMYWNKQIQQRIGRGNRPKSWRVAYVLMLLLTLGFGFSAMQPAQAAPSLTLGNLNIGILSNNATPVVNTTISVAKTGSEPFDLTTWDGSDLATAGYDADEDNNVVRLQDSITYLVEVSVNDNDVTSLTATVELDAKQAWIEIPNGCETDEDIVSPVSSISADKRTLFCNFGSAIEGTTRAIYPTARAIGASYDGTAITLNADHVSASVSAQADSSAVATAGPTDVVVTANFKVDTIKELKVTKLDENTGEPIYIAPDMPGPSGEEGTLLEYVIKVQYVSGSMIADAPDEVGGDFEADYLLLDHFTDNNIYNDPPTSTLSSGGQLYTWNPTLPACELVGDHGPNASVTCTQVNHLLDDLSSTLASDGTNDPNIEIDLQNIDVRDPDKDANLVELKLNLWFTRSTEIETHQTCASGRCTNNVINAVGVYSSTNGTVEGFNPVSTEDAANNNLLNYNGVGEPEPNYVDYNMAYSTGGSLSMWISYYALFPQEDWAAEQYAAVGDTLTFLVNHFDYRRIDGALSQTCSKVDTSMFEYVGLSEPYHPDMGYAFNTDDAFNPHMAYRPIGESWTQGFDGDPFITILYTDEATASLTDLRDATCDNDVNGDTKYVIDGVNVDTGLADSPSDWVSDPATLSGGTGTVTRIRTTVVYDQALVNEIDPAHDQFGVFTNHEVRIKNDAAGYGPSKYLPIFITDRYTDETGVFNGWRDISSASVVTNSVDFSSLWGSADRTILVPSSHNINKYTEPRGIKVVRGGEQVDFIIEPQIYGMWSPTITHAFIDDVLPVGTEYVLDSSQFSADNGTTWLDYDAYIASSPVVSLTTTPNTHSRLLRWYFDDVNTGDQLPLIRYRVNIDPDRVSGTFVNTAVLTSDIGADGDDADLISDPVEAAYQLSIFSTAGIDVLKQVDYPIYEVNQPFEFDLTYKNLGAEDYSGGNFIDILPYNGDGAGQNSSGLASTRRPSSTFNGTYEVTGVTIANGETVYATDRASASVQQDPCHESNQAGAYVPVDGDLCYLMYINNGNQFAGGSATGTGATTWTECTSLSPVVCGGLSAESITALRFDVPPLAAVDGGHQITLELTPLGNVGGTPVLDASGNVTDTSTGDIYTNNFGGRVPELSLQVISNDVSVTMVAGSIGDRVWLDVNSNGAQDPIEIGIENVTLQLYDGSNNPIYRNPTTGGIYTTQITGTVPYTMTTDSSGNYTFTNLPVGTYEVRVDTATIPTDFTQTYDADGGFDHSSTHTLTTIQSAAGQLSGVEDNTEQDFGYAPSVDVKQVKIGDYVWFDVDCDGNQDEIGRGIPNVTVDLYDRFGTFVISTTTDATGFYTFTKDIHPILPDEPYTIRIDTTQPALDDFTPTQADNATAGDANDSDGQPGSGSFINYVETSATTPSLGSVDFNYDFGFYQELGAIGNYIWLDENGDGEQDEGERGIPNVFINLTDEAGNVYTTTTDSQGGYLFDTLPQGTYIVSVPAQTGSDEALEGLNYTTANPNSGGDFGNQDPTGYAVTIGGTEPLENLSADFGYNYNTPAETDSPSGDTAALGDRIWIDSDGDGAQDPNEIGVEGVTVTLYHDPDGNGVYDTVYGTTTTDENGLYIFDDLPAGAYVATVTDDAGASHDILNTGDYTQTGDPDHFGTTGSNNDNTMQPVVLAPGDVFLNADFGYNPTGVTLGTIGDTVWFDADASGTATQDVGESGVEGVTVALIQDTNGNGVWDAGEPIIASDTTDENGNYLFEGLSLDDGGGDADYIVWVNDTDNVLDGLQQTYDQDSPLDNMSATALSSGTPSDLDQDFSYAPAGHSSGDGLIGDTIWFDSDNSGDDQTNQGDEPGIEGVLVTLTDSSGTVITTTTDENGSYYFGGLDTNATYTVTVAPENFHSGGVLEGLAETYDPDGGTASQSVVDLSADPDGINLDQDFSYIGDSNDTLGSIGNRVWLDQNADGDWDGADGSDNTASIDDDEPGIAGVTLDLYRDLNGNGVIDAGEPRIGTTTTDANGNYLFNNLPLGDYVVDVTDEAGVLAGHWHSLGNQDATAGDPSADEQDQSKADPFAITLDITNPNNLNIDFGYYVEPAAVGNYIWVDANENGLQDDGETGINGVEVQLVVEYDDGTTVTLTTVTANDSSGNAGWYSFNNLLLDEDYAQGSSTSSATATQPAYTISVDINQTALGNYAPTMSDANSNADDAQDSDNPNGVIAVPTQGLVDVDAQDPATDEQTIASYDFGFVEQIVVGAIGNYIWLDENSDGYQDTGEPGLANVVVNLTDSSGVVYTTTTDAKGGYLFPDLAAGMYTVTVPTQTGSGEALEGLAQTAAQPIPAQADFGNQTSPYVIVLGAGEENLTADFGYNANNTNTNSGLGALGDRVWLDGDGDGFQDPDEVGIADVCLELVTAGADGLFGTADDVVVSSTTTDATGGYLFDNLAANAYVVRECAVNAPLAGLTQTGDPDHFGTTGTVNDGQTTIPVVLGPGDVFLNVDFGYQPATCHTLGDLIFFDAGANGTFDGSDYGIAGISVALIHDVNGDGMWDADGVDNTYGTSDDEAMIGQDVTDASGGYLFSCLLDDDYITFVNDTDSVLLGLEQSATPNNAANNGQACGTCNDMNGVTISGSDNLNQDYGYTPVGHTSALGAIGDTIWLDRDGSGNATQDAGEPGIEGVTVMLTDGNGVTQTTTTDENGHYYFGGLPLGTYTVTVPASNFASGGVLEGTTNTYDPDNDDDNAGIGVTLTGGSPINLDQDFSYTANDGQIGNLVWLDYNTDGDDDSGTAGSGEAPIAGVTLDLYRDLDCDGNLDVGEPLFSSTTTVGAVDAGEYGTNGTYDFDSLPVVGAGGSGGACYIVDVTDEDGILLGYWHSLGTTATDDNSQLDPYGSIELTAGSPTNLTADFGYYLDPAAVGNYVWFDTNMNGIQENGEPGLNGITVTLAITYPDGTNLSFSMMTGDDPDTVAVERGWYSFRNLLLDEDYMMTSGTVTPTVSPQEPAMVISAEILPGYRTTLTDAVAANDQNDSDEQSGVPANVAMGTNAVPQNADPTAEANPYATYDFGQVRVELGDLPDQYNTFASNSGATHIVFPDDDNDNMPDLTGAIWAGAIVDVEPDGQSGGDNGATEGDDDDGIDDEDGLELPPQKEIIVGNTVVFTITLRSRGVQTADYGLWLDWNGNGVFTDTNEFLSMNDISIDTLVSGDLYETTFTLQTIVPAGTVTHPNWIYIRGRVFAANTTVTRDVSNTSHAGLAGNGEVEDFAMRPLSPTAIGLQSQTIGQSVPLLGMLGVILSVMTGWSLRHWRRKRSL